jgi:hypothetical protein
MSIFFVASSFSLVNPYFSVSPNVDELCVGVYDRVPGLCDASFIPTAEELI